MSGFEIIIKRKAQIDLDEAFVWYEEQKSGLGKEFIIEFENILNKISRNPFHASYIFKEARSVSLKRFPYHIIYKANEQNKQVKILAITHHSRNPEWYRRRLGS